MRTPKVVEAGQITGQMFAVKISGSSESQEWREIFTVPGSDKSTLQDPIILREGGGGE